MTHKIGQWIALEQDGQVFTGKITGIENRRGGTTLTVDILADNQYRHLVDPRWMPRNTTTTQAVDENADSP